VQPFATGCNRFLVGSDQIYFLIKTSPKTAQTVKKWASYDQYKYFTNANAILLAVSTLSSDTSLTLNPKLLYFILAYCFNLVWFWWVERY
jgi:hypothetical protein